MSEAVVGAGDERRHRPGGDSRWAESWWFDFAAPDASFGGFARLELYPNRGVAWCWAALVGQGRRLLLVRDHDLSVPRGAALEVRGQGLWWAATCETALEHWSVGLEAFAVAFDDPREAWLSERGDLVGLGFDLEWEATAPARATGPGGGYHQPCRVSGEILVAEEQLAFDGVGFRGHRWGIRDWRSGSRHRLSCTLDDGTALWLDDASVSTDPDGLVTGAEAPEGGGGTLHVQPLSPAPLLVDAIDGRRARLSTALCRVDATGGRSGPGWVTSLFDPASDTTAH